MKKNIIKLSLIILIALIAIYTIFVFVVTTCFENSLEKKIKHHTNTIELLKECRYMMDNTQLFEPCDDSHDSMNITIRLDTLNFKCAIPPIIKSLEPEVIFLSKNMVITVLDGRSLALYALRGDDTTSLNYKKNKKKIIDGLWLVGGE